MVTLRINGKNYTIDVPTNMPLLWAIRDACGLTGTKYGCGIEECGACTVLIDGEAERSCDKTVADAIGVQITTIEGLATNLPNPVQQAWISHQVPQCGYCQSGMIMATVSLLRRNPNPTDAQIASAISNICACGTYQRVRDAIKSLAGVKV